MSDTLQLAIDGEDISFTFTDPGNATAADIAKAIQRQLQTRMPDAHVAAFGGGISIGSRAVVKETPMTDMEAPKPWGRRLARYQLAYEVTWHFGIDEVKPGGRFRSSQERCYRCAVWLLELCTLIQPEAHSEPVSGSDEPLRLTARTLRRIARNRRALAAAHRLGGTDAVLELWGALSGSQAASKPGAGSDGSICVRNGSEPLSTAANASDEGSA